MTGIGPVTARTDVRSQVVLVAAEEFEVRPAQVLEPGPDEALVATIETGVCASDVKMYAGQHPVNRPPLVLGHEIRGTLLTATAGLDSGSEVAVLPLLSCGSCRACRAGRPNTCAQMGIIGAQRPGALGGVVTVPVAGLVPMDPRIPTGLRVVVEPLAVAVHAARRAGEVAGAEVAVVGAGPIGLLLAMVLREAGAEVTLCDLDRSRLELSAGTAGVGAVIRLPEATYDVAFDCVGGPAPARTALASTRPGGTAVLVGIQPGELGLDGVAVQRGERDVLGAQLYTRDDFREAMRLLATVPAFAALDTDQHIRRHPVADAPEVFTRLHAGDRSALKHVLVF